MMVLGEMGVLLPRQVRGRRVGIGSKGAWRRRVRDYEEE